MKHPVNVFVDYSIIMHCHWWA